jgi:hypothetical protein
VRVKLRRASNRLTRVVDDEIEPWKRFQQLPAQRLDAGRVAQIQSEDLESIAPLVEIRFLRVTPRRIRGKRVVTIKRAPARNSLRPGLIADLHAPAGQQCHAAMQVGQLGALVEIELRTRRTHLIVEMVEVENFCLQM